MMVNIILPFVFATIISSSPLDPRSDPIACPTTPTFTYTNISYCSILTGDAPDHLNFTEAKISFNLANSAISYLLFCEGVSNTPPSFFDGSQGYICRNNDLSVGASMTY
ncbi:hypothetical protein BJ875DRAFT_226184 [Amylocarpus encephaloides]|uniref:Uncharacterized protein n=1 Tax=Amylocarpus encephaloides TaxID=45428 RepID=A0A9P8BZQ5_9HELO|nr:hypothetical protein BJ875DRAFT_226184 [Amylocarpus encephaloides]